MATKKDIHELADSKNIPWDDDPSFKSWSKKITGKARLDDMNPEQLTKLKKALNSKEKNASLKKVWAFLRNLPPDEALATVVGGVGGGPIPGSSLATLAAYRGAKDVVRIGPPGSAHRRMALKLKEMQKADREAATWKALVKGEAPWNLNKKLASVQSHTGGGLTQKGGLSQDRRERLARGSAFGVGFAAPVSAGQIGKKTISGPFSGQSFASVTDLAKHAKPGDLLMVGHAGSAVDIRKSIISLGTGLPHGYHAAIVGEVSKKKGTVTIYDLTAKGYRSKEIPLSSVQHYSLFRPNSPKVAARARNNMMNLVRIQESLVTELKAQGMNDRAIKRITDGMYQHKMNPVIGVRELFIPYVKDQTQHNAAVVRRTERKIRMLRLNTKGIAADIAAEWKQTGRIDTKLLEPLKNVCTNTAAMVGIPVGPGSRADWAGPNDFLRSGKLKNVGYRVSPRYQGFVKYFDKLLTASPHLIRAGVGLGAGSVLAGYVTARQWSKKKGNRKLVRKGLRFKRQIFISGYTRSDGSVVKGHIKTASFLSSEPPPKSAKNITRKDVFVRGKLTGRSMNGGNVTWELIRKDTGDSIGVLKTKGNQVSWSSLNPEYRGKGLGRKLYGEVMREMPGGVLKSDSVLSPNSTGVWKSFSRRDTGIKGDKPWLNLTLGDTRRNKGIVGRGEGYKTMLRSQYNARIPKAALRNSKLTAKITQTAGERLTSLGNKAVLPALLATYAGGVGLMLKDEANRNKARKSKKATEQKTKAASIEDIRTSSYQRGLTRAASVMELIGA